MAQALDFGKIKDSCSNLTSLATSLGTTVETIESAIKKIQDPAWVGKASEAYRDKINTLAAHLPEANRQLAEAIIFLASCADAYDQLSAEAVKKLKNLIGGQDYIDKYDVNSAPDVDLNSRYGQDDSKKEDPKNDEENETSKTPKSSGCNSSGCSSRGCGGCGSSASPSPSPATPSPTNTTPETVPETTPEIVEINGIKEIGYGTVSLENADEKTKFLFESDKFKYKDGYGMYDEYYLIACDSSVGKVGDVIKFTLKDGKVITCIVAVNTTDEKDKNKISFIIEKKDGFKEIDLLKDLLNNTSKIENCGDCKSVLGIEMPSSIKVGNYDMNNYPKELTTKAALDRGTLVAKYLMDKGGFTAEQAAGLVGVYIDENGCYPGDTPGSVKETEMKTLGDGYGAGIASWTTTEVKNSVLQDAGYPAGTKIENLSLQQQCDLIIAGSQKTFKTYYDALRRCNTVEDASATAVVLTGGVGLSNNWSTHPTPADAKYVADYYASANDKTFGYSDYHHNLDQRRLEYSKKILENLKKESEANSTNNNNNSTLVAV